jgi:three-Cys-motif partner protein
MAPNRTVAENLKSLISPHNINHNAEVITGNPNNEKALSRLLDNVPRSASAIVFIDANGYRKLNWSTLESMAAHGKNWQGLKIDLLIIFPLEMALLRNLLRPECAVSVTRFYGNRLWEDIKRQMQIKMDPADTKEKLVELYKDGLRNLGYRYVESFKPASTTHDPYYFLIYASDNMSRRKYLKEAWGKPRFLRCELLYGVTNKET